MKTTRWMALAVATAVAVYGGGCSAEVGASQQAIVNGRAATAAEVWGTVAIPIGGIVDPMSQDNCTGTVIRPRAVLTAAHCFFTTDAMNNPTNMMEPLSRIEVVAGPLTIQGAQTEERYTVTRVVVHPGYDNVNGRPDLGPAASDIALVEVDRDITQVPVTATAQAGDPAMGSTVTISGYGSTMLDGMGQPTGGGALMLAEVNVVDASATEFLASSTTGMDTCPGDSGGPAYLFDGNNTPRVVGVTSRADPNAVAACGEGGIYTSVAAFQTWIDQEVGPAPQPMADGGGGCSVATRSGGSTPLALLAALGLLAWWRRRRALG